MTTHLTDAELRDFAAGVLAPEDLLRADDHLFQCDQCRVLAARVNDASGRIGDFRAQLSDPATAHLSDEELLLLVKQQLPAGRREAAVRHLKECATCDAQVDELRDWSVAAPRVNWSNLAVAAAVALCVLVPFAIWQSRAQRPATTASSLAGLDALPTVDEMRVRAALDAGAASLPAFISEIAASREVLMGRPAKRGDTLEVVAPVGTGTVSDRPQFRWQALSRADGYVVTVFDERSNVVARSPTVTLTNWTPAEPLARDRTYVWQVTADRGGETIIAPVPPAAPAKFHVIDAHSADVLAQLEREHQQSQLLLGILYMDRGVVDVAATHLRQVQPSDAHAAVATRSLETLAALGAPVRTH